MWKLQHLNGRREINELHVPVGQTVKLTMGTQDVIHSFYVPAFRMKQDVVPGRFTTTWFKATKPGKYHLFCAEYCGTNHSRMVGSIYVMEPSDFQEWLSGTTGSTPAEAGKAIFESQACITCHSPGSGARGPNLVGLFGTEVRLQGGNTVTADENYIRESILNPQAKIVHGYQPIMPTFKGLINEEQVMQLTAYIKSLKSGSGDVGVGSTQQVAGPAGQLPPHVARETLMQTNKPESEQPAPSVPSPTPATIEIKSAPSQATPGPGTIQTTEPQGASSVPVDQGTTRSRQEWQ
jgi:cytochrome c oxidase subunit 2